MGTTDDAVIQRATAVLLFSAWVLAARTPTAAALWLNLPPSARKCVSEEIHAGIVVLADYAVIHEGDPQMVPTISAKVTAPKGNILHHNENATIGQFAFTTSEPGNYLACFWQDGPNKGTGTSVSINWRIGIAAKDWPSIARKDKIEGVELELRKLEEAVEAIHDNLLYLRSREATMRDLSEKTNSRVAWFGIMSLGVCILASAVQVWYLKGFFLKKKLI
ncbi:transmembrane emp24 domain-containing protein p24delta4-like [Canna indica]|uniref:Transmembrane emp24 domain-containing protein p24delta4-like n=1 Tax=Canna indica TaxID=4628 RepID=A0AAQ3K6H3_9LILI|nr:transmembrane emp24 domain-containing protein p24delta4-like [Canna indica]